MSKAAVPGKNLHPQTHIISTVRVGVYGGVHVNTQGSAVRSDIILIGICTKWKEGVLTLNLIRAVVCQQSERCGLLTGGFIGGAEYLG